MSFVHQVARQGKWSVLQECHVLTREVAKVPCDVHHMCHVCQMCHVPIREVTHQGGWPDAVSRDNMEADKAIFTC